MVEGFHFLLRQGFKNILKIFIDVIHRFQEFEAFVGDQDIYAAPVNRAFAPVQQVFGFELIHDPGSIAHAVKHPFLDELHTARVRMLPSQDPQYVELLHGNIRAAEQSTVVSVEPIVGIGQVYGQLLGFALEFLLLYFVF